jgi:DNA-binding IclR family transcriptional regulator
MKPTANAAQAKTSGTQVLERTGILLRLLTANSRTGLRLVDLYRQASLERPTVHRILQALVAERLIRQDRSSKRYYLGPLVYEMGLAATPPVALRDICQPYIKEVADQTEDTVFLALRSGLDGVCVARSEGRYPIKAFVLNVGHRRPLNVGGSGLAILGAMDQWECSNICDANQERSAQLYPRYSREVVERQLAEARRVGYVLNDVLYVQGARSLGLAIRDGSGTPIASVSLSAVTSRVSGRRIEYLATCLSGAVAAIEAAHAAASTSAHVAGMAEAA